MKRIAPIWLFTLIILSCTETITKEESREYSYLPFNKREVDDYNKSKVNITSTNEVKISPPHINFDTIIIQNDFELRSTIFFKGYLICFLSNPVKKGHIKNRNRILKVDIKRKKSFQLGLPEKLPNILNYDIEIEGDSLYVYNDFNTYVIGQDDSLFKNTINRDFKLFTDCRYNIKYRDHGEWGGETLFEELNTNNTYRYKSSTPFVVNKLSDSYYITQHYTTVFGSNQVVKIDSPELLPKVEDAPSLNNNKGQIIFNSKHIGPQTSLVIDSNLVHIFSYHDTTYLGVIRDSILEPVYTFNEYFTVHSPIIENNTKQQLHLNFHGNSGVLEIIDSHFRFYIVINENC